MGLLPSMLGVDAIQHRMTEQLRAIDSVFASLPSGYQSAKAERELLERASGEDGATYGEIHPLGSARMLRWLRLGPDDQFVDLGSGTGRLPLQAAVTTAVGRAVGIELCPVRHEIACEAKRLYLSQLPPSQSAALDARLLLKREDLLTTDLSEATIVFLGATCFPITLVTHVARQLAESSKLRFFLSTKPLPSYRSSLLQDCGSMMLPMSWAPRVRVHVYGATCTVPRNFSKKLSIRCQASPQACD